MTAHSSPPNHRRRRFLIVTIVGMVFGLAWWFRPLADPRFVGKWEVIPKGSPSNYSGWSWILLDNGTAELLLPNGTHEANFAWQAQGQSFSMSGYTANFNPLHQQWYFLMRRLSGLRIAYEIVETTEETITLHSLRKGTGMDDFTLRRVSQ